jgi:hypothetical protein
MPGSSSARIVAGGSLITNPDLPRRHFATVCHPDFWNLKDRIS